MTSPTPPGPVQPPPPAVGPALGEGPPPGGRPPIDAPPPLLGTWPKVYLLVVISQGVIIALLALLTHVFD